MKSRGGKRENAGRPLGTNAYGESTVPIRVPKSQITHIKDYLKAYAINSESGHIDFHEHILQVSTPKVAITPQLSHKKLTCSSMETKASGESVNFSIVA